MRELKDHIVKGTPVYETIKVTDEPGHGGACHEYLIEGEDEFGKVQHLISFQNGAIKEHGVNGTTQEALLTIVIDRLRSFQSGDFPCGENAIALTKSEEALMWLNKRTSDRISRNVEGTDVQ